MKSKILFWMTFALCCIFATYFAVRLTMGFMGRSGILDIHKISLSSDGGKIDKMTILGALNISAGTPSYDIDLNAALSRIMEIPDIDAASVRRMGNGNLVVKVRVKTAVASWTDGTTFYPVAMDGSLINRPTRDAIPNLPVFRGQISNNITGIIDIMKKHPALIAGTEYIEWIEGRRYDIHLTSGTVIKLPEQGIENAVQNIIDMNKKTNILSRELKIIDMRDSARTLVGI